MVSAFLIRGINKPCIRVDWECYAQNFIYSYLLISLGSGISTGCFAERVTENVPISLFCFIITYYYLDWEYVFLCRKTIFSKYATSIEEDFFSADAKGILEEILPWKCID